MQKSIPTGNFSQEGQQKGDFVLKINIFWAQNMLKFGKGSLGCDLTFIVEGASEVPSFPPSFRDMYQAPATDQALLGLLGTQQWAGASSPGAYRAGGMPDSEQPQETVDGQWTNAGSCVLRNDWGCFRNDCDHPTGDGNIKLRPACVVSGGHRKSQESRVREEGRAATKASSTFTE